MILILVIAVVVEASVVVVNIIIVDLFSGGLKPFLIYIWTLSALLIPWHRIGLIFLYPSSLDHYLLTKSHIFYSCRELTSLCLLILLLALRVPSFWGQ